MRPTFSIIFFTVVSGAGFGLLALLGLALAIGPMPIVSAWLPIDVNCLWAARASVANPRTALALALACGAALGGLGLIASLGHLGKPQRAWRALSQWRSSWLSREGVASLLTYLPLLALLVLLLVTDPGHASGVSLRVCGVLLCASALATIICTANIYASLKPVRAWHHPLVLPGYLVLAVYSGLLWLIALATIGIPTQHVGTLAWLANALIVAPCAAVLKVRYWRSIDTPNDFPDAGRATGLVRFGAVSSVERPHTEENYLTREMGFVLARKHSARLRIIALSLIVLAPIVSLPFACWIAVPAAWLALFLGMLGVFIERWLFFAEARHAVMAYYGAAQG